MNASYVFASIVFIVLSLPAYSDGSDKLSCSKPYDRGEVLNSKDRELAFEQVVKFKECLSSSRHCNGNEVVGLSELSIPSDKLTSFFVKKNIALIEKSKFNEYERELIDILFCPYGTDGSYVGVYLVPLESGKIKWHVFKVIAD